MSISRALFFIGCFSSLGVLFYSSGYMMGRGLLHARLPKPAKPARVPRLDPKMLLSGDGAQLVERAAESVDVGGIAKQVIRFAGIGERTLHTPSNDIEKLKKEPLFDPPSRPQHRVHPFNEPPEGTFYVTQ